MGTRPNMVASRLKNGRRGGLRKRFGRGYSLVEPRPFFLLRNQGARMDRHTGNRHRHAERRQQETGRLRPRSGSNGSRPNHRHGEKRQQTRTLPVRSLRQRGGRVQNRPKTFNRVGRLQPVTRGSRVRRMMRDTRRGTNMTRHRSRTKTTTTPRNRRGNRRHRHDRRSRLGNIIGSLGTRHHPSYTSFRYYNTNNETK